MTGYMNLNTKHSHAYQAKKAGNCKPVGLLQSLQIPDRPRVSVCMDLITAHCPPGLGRIELWWRVTGSQRCVHFEACCTTITAV